MRVLVGCEFSNTVAGAFRALGHEAWSCDLLPTEGDPAWHSKIRKPDQVIQPWQFGHGETKATCLWLKNLPKLVPTNIVEGREARVHKMPPGPNRWKERSRTFKGIAEAMATQWGAL